MPKSGCTPLKIMCHLGNSARFSLQGTSFFYADDFSLMWSIVILIPFFFCNFANQAVQLSQSHLDVYVWSFTDHTPMHGHKCPRIGPWTILMIKRKFILSSCSSYEDSVWVKRHCRKQSSTT